MTRLARAVDLLLPLAYAQGAGLPWKTSGPRWPTPLLQDTATPTRTRCGWLAGHAGSFIAEAGTIADRSVYRLYHRSLAEHLLIGRDHDADQHAITTTLAGHVPRRDNGGADWAAAHPYIRAHLATHAASGGDLDDLAQDPDSCSPQTRPRCWPPSNRDQPAARAAAAAYWQALPHIRRHPTEGYAYLGLAARCGRANALADRIEADGLTGPWHARWASWQLPGHLQQLTGHDGSVTAVAAGELEGRPVVISGSEDQTVRVWDLATGAPIGTPLPATWDWVRTVATAELDGRPVIALRQRRLPRQRRPDGAGVGPGHRRPHRHPSPPRRVRYRGHRRRAARPTGHHLRQHRPDRAGVGPGHRRPPPP